MGWVLFPLLMLVVPPLAATTAASYLRKWRPGWSSARIACVAAMPIPALIVAPCIYLIVNASTASKAQCGVDACGMAIAAGMFMVMLAGAIYIVSAATAAVMLRRWNENR